MMPRRAKKFPTSVTFFAAAPEPDRDLRSQRCDLRKQSQRAMVATMLDLLRRRPDFRKYWLADAVSLIGDWLSYVAVAVLVVEAKGGWTALATVLVLHTLPASLASPVAGWLTDRMDARRLMVLSAVLRGLLTLAMTAAAANGSLLWLQLCLFVRMAVGSSEHTAGRAVLKRVVATEELGLANAIGGATWSLLFALGVAMGGVVASQIGPIWALVLDAATFFLSAGLLLRLPALPATPTPTPTGGQDERGLGEAIALARRTPVLRALVFGKMPLALATGGAWSSSTTSLSALIACVTPPWLSVYCRPRAPSAQGSVRSPSGATTAEVTGDPAP